MNIEIIETEALGNRGYLVHDGSVAVALDVQRDYQRWLDLASSKKVTITHVIETHMHNDYVTGGYQLAQSINAQYVVPANSGTTFESHAIADLESLTVGNITVTALHTPGHTEHHMSYRMSDGDNEAVFTGGGILYGTVGRTDLVSPEKTQQLTSAQYDSAQRLRGELAGETAVYPTHGFGSFCSSSAGTGASSSTLATEERYNIAFTSKDKAAFIETIIAGLGPYPRYYAHMGGMNQAGPPEAAQFHLHEYSVDDMTQLLAQEKSWVIDIRQRKAFAAHHPEGAVGIELGKSFSTYSGWIIPWGESMTLVGDSVDGLKEAYVELSRIGMDQFVAGGDANLDTYFSAGKHEHYPVTNFTALQKVMETETPYVLDVRLESDWQISHVKGAVSIPLHELTERIGELPHVPIWVHCASGYRASIAASLIAKSGGHPQLIDDAFDTATRLNITT